MKHKILFLLISFLTLLNFNTKACHALPIVNFQVTQVAGGIELNGSSNSATCGCTNIYWMDIEVRCVGEPFDGAPFNPGFWGPLTTYPYFQSTQLNKPGCILTPYPTTFIPYGAMCPGIDYVVRVRENHNGDVGSWSAPISFTVPGVQVPLTGTITASPPSVCVGDPVELEFNTTGGCSNGLDFEWESSPDVGGSPSGTWTYVGNTNPITVFPTQDTWYQVTIEGSCGNDFLQLMILVTVLPPPNPGISSIDDILVCEGDFTTVFITGQGGLIQWQSSENGGPWTNIPNATTDNLQVGPINTTTCFRAEIVGCGATVYSNEVCVNIAPLPNLQINNQIICQGQTTELISTVDLQGGTYIWNNDPILNTPNLNNLSPNQTTTYELEYNLNGCVITTTADVIVNQLPDLNFSVENVCLDDISIFINSSLNTSTWNWNFGDGNTSNLENPEHIYNQSGIYQVTLIGISSDGCENNISVFTEVYQNPVADFSPTDVCLNESSNFTDLSTGNVISWTWNFDDGNSSTDQNPTHTYSNIGIYNVGLQVVSADGCVHDTIKTTTVHDSPTINLSGNNLQGCSPVCFEVFSNTISNDSIIEWNWTLSNGSIYTGQNISDCIENNSQNDIILGITLEVVSEYGCVSEVSESNYIEVWKNAIANFNYTPNNINILNSEVSFINNSTNSDYYLWNIGGYISSDINPTYDFGENPGDYIITLISYTNNGCNDTIIGILNIEDLTIFYVPNTFTPDDDLFNKIFKPIFTSGFNPLNYKLEIFNRWGEILFESNNSEVGWNGTYGGNIVKDGTYIWIITYQKENSTVVEKIKGHVNLLR